ncbi:DUF308 domain-containing protein [Herpetosiphon giganteus]|uniref:DUF308 domain-containing protein n=1 Tax=Herpetosiphon giganteus TaxID=2029754 RepID=UPI00195D6E45|nr:DUF308 domain-containing protein [Herpetosiphon giganteus]MBM7845874.1 hypothetical protein [Herpetosiphon giganteus]
MHCPRCQQKVDLHINQCPKCDRKLKPLILSQQIPLTPQLRQALRREIVVFSIWLGLLACTGIILYFALRHESRGWLLIWPIFGLIVVLVGCALLSRVRDLLAGYAHVQIDQLLKLHYVRSSRQRGYLHGDFKLIGSQNLKLEHSGVAREGNYYVITHSPRDKNVWELAKLRREVST